MMPLSVGYLEEIVEDPYWATAEMSKQMAAELLRLRADAARLDRLEELVRAERGGLLLHEQVSDVAWTGYGLGLQHRTLRAAIDASMKGNP